MAIDIKSYIPDLGILTSFKIASIVIGLLIVFAVIGAIVLYFYIKRQYKIIVVVLEQIGSEGKLQIVDRDVAKRIKFGNSPQGALYLKRLGVFRPDYGRKIADNTYAYVIAPNGYWYNVVFDSFDSVTKKMSVEIVDKNVAMAYEAMRENLDERFKKKKFWDVYGAMVIHGIFLIIVALILWFIMGRFLQIADRFGILIEKSGEILNLAIDTLKHSNALQATSGVR